MSSKKTYPCTARQREEHQDEVFFESTFRKLQHFKLPNFLERHGVNERLRAKMLDWMIEVLNIYQQKEQTIFRAIFLLDYFLWKSPLKIPAKNLHLLGTVCLMLASKNQEVQYIHTS